MRDNLVKEIMKMGADEKDAQYFVDAIISILKKWHIHDILTLLEDWND